MHKLYSLKKSTQGLLTSFFLFMMAVLFTQPLAAQADSLRPDIRFFSPVSARQGTLIDIVGENFIGTTGVSFGGTPAASIQVLSDSLIRAKVGTGSSGFVRVTTPFGTDSLGGFTFLRDTLPPDSLRPDITSFTPRSARTGQNVFIFGNRFTGATSVSFGNVPAQSFVVFADTGIRAVVGPGASGAVRVATSFGSDTLGGFTFIRDSLPPDITSFTPTSARQGQTVFIFGKRFTGATSVSFGNVPASFTVFADSGIKAIVGPGASGAVRVVTPFGMDTLGGFIFIRDTLPPDSLRPDITSFTPKSARQGQNVFIFGRNFTGTSSVSFGNIPAQSFIVFADTGIRAVVGPGASGAVRVTTPFGSDTLGGFIFIRDTLPPDSLRPDIIKFSPTIGTTGTKVFIAGLHFKGVTAVSFGGVPAASFTVLSDSAITAIVDTGATGLVKVANRFGSDTMGTFIYKRPIIIHDSLSVAPNPATTYTIVTHPVSTSTALLKLTDISGNSVKAVKVSPHVSRTRLDLTGVKPGVYKLSWSDGARVLSVTLLVN